jgi:hypothetical protein
MYNIRNIFGFSLVMINFIALLIMTQTGELIGDVKGIPVYDQNALLVSGLLVCSSYIIILFIFYPLLLKVKIPKIRFKYEAIFESRISFILIVLQILFLIFNLSNGVNIAGSGNVETSSIFSVFWIFFPIDLFFVIYYAFCRNARLFRINLLIAIISSLVRGRADIFLLVLFFELSKKIKNKNLSVKKLLVVSGITLAVYPVLLLVKFAFRLYLGETGDQPLDYYLLELMNDGKRDGYFYAFYSGIEHIIGRLQTVSIVAEIYRLSDLLQNLYYQGGFFPFWLEGLHGIILDKLLGESRNVPLGTAFTGIGDFNWQFNVGDWNTNPGFSGWIVLNPLWLGGYLLYTALLCLLSVVFTKLIGESDLRDDMLWYSWAFYLMPAWLGVFFLFIYTLGLFFFIKWIISVIPPIRFLSPKL